MIFYNITVIGKIEHIISVILLQKNTINYLLWVHSISMLVFRHLKASALQIQLCSTYYTALWIKVQHDKHLCNQFMPLWKIQLCFVHAFISVSTRFNRLYIVLIWWGGLYWLGCPQVSRALRWFFVACPPPPAFTLVDRDVVRIGCCCCYCCCSCVGGMTTGLFLLMSSMFMSSMSSPTRGSGDGVKCSWDGVVILKFSYKSSSYDESQSDILWWVNVSWEGNRGNWDM